MVASASVMFWRNELPRWGFTWPFAPSELWFHSRFRLPRRVRESSSDKSLEEVEKPSEVSNFHLNRSSVHSFTRPPLLFNFVYTDEGSINVTPKPFAWMNVPPLCICAQNFVPKIARSTPLLRYRWSLLVMGSCHN